MEQQSQTSDFTVAEITLSYRSKTKASQRLKITDSKSAYNILLHAWDENCIELSEQFKILLLNRANHVLGVYSLSSGGITGTVADPRLIFAAALKANACGIILAHNHPSGNLVPSTADKLLTSKISQGGKYLDIQTLDHLIITSEGYYSFADEGIL